MAHMADNKADTVKRTKEKARRQYGTGSVFQKCEARFGCPPLVDDVRPKHKCKGRWFGEYGVGFKKNGGRDRRTVSASTEAEAKRRLAAKLRELDRDGSSSSVGRTTVKTWAGEWLTIAEKSNRPNSQTVDIAGAKWIVEAIGHRQLSQLEPRDVRAVHAAIEATCKSSTAARYHGTLMRMLKAAALEGHRIPQNTFLVEMPTPDVNDRDAVPLDKALRMLKVATELPHASRWIAALLQGVRQGEALGLTWDEVTEDHFTLAWQLQPLPYKIKRDTTSGFRIPRGYEVRQLDGQMHLVRPKSKAGWRIVPMLPVMWQALEAWKEIAPKNDHGLVWPSSSGRPANEDDDRQEWYGIQGNAEVGHEKGSRYYKVHEARHTTGTLLRLLNVPDATRIAIMGWSSVASGKAYEHVDAAVMKEMRDALQSVAGVLELE